MIWNDSAAVCPAKKLAQGRDFEVWCVAWFRAGRPSLERFNAGMKFSDHVAA
jgi:hypothetical protein